MPNWTNEKIEFLKHYYSLKGKQWCMDALSLPEGTIRSKAARLKLKAKGVSEAWHQSNKDHSARMTGRKRPDQSLVMKRLHLEGKLLMTDETKAKISALTKKHIAENGHPKGFLGAKHSIETKAKIGAKSKAAWDAMTEEKIVRRNIKMLKTKVENGTLVPPRNNASWKAAWHEIGGKRKYFRSNWEANYAYYLEWLKVNGHIQDWEHEPKTFWFEGVKRGVVSYLPDFLVIENNGSESYHEVKGWMDPRSKTKLKRMAKYHPTVRLVLIDARQYKSIKSKVSKLVPGWKD